MEDRNASATDVQMTATFEGIVRSFAQFVSINEKLIEKMDISEALEFVRVCQRFVDL